jgi:hypothetical protein
MYAAIATRPEIQNAVTAVSQYNSQPFTSHITTTKCVLQYLKSTADCHLHLYINGNWFGFGSGNYFGIGIDNRDSTVGYLDYDLANYNLHQKFHSGHVYIACNCNAASWHSSKQDLITMSTLEAEIIAYSGASSDAKPYSNCAKTFTLKTCRRYQSNVAMMEPSLGSPHES